MTKNLHNTPKLETSSDRRGWKIAKVGSLLASLVASATLHIGIDRSGGDRSDHTAVDTEASITLPSEMREVTKKGIKLVEGPHEEAVVDSNQDETGVIIKPESTVTAEQSYPLDGATDWSEKFAESESAREVNETAIEQTVHTIESLRDNGYTSFVVEIIGKTSAEDNTPASIDGSRAGVQSNSDQNRELGDVRGAEHASALLEILQNDSSVEIVQGESIEQSVSDGEVMVLDTLSEQFGYNSVKQMIEQWNRSPQAVPPAVSEVLGSLTAHRGVKVTITATRPATSEETNSYELEGEQATDIACVTTIREVSLEPVRERGPEKDVQIPVVIPWVVFIPIVRRRTDEEERDAVQSKRQKEFRKKLRKQDLAQLKSLLLRSRKSTGGLFGNSDKTIVEDDEPIAETPPTDSGNTPESTEPPKKPEPTPPEEEEEKKRRRKWPIIIPIVLFASGLGLHLNNDSSSTPRSSSEPTSTPETCATDLERIFEVQREDGSVEYLKEGDITKDSKIVVREDGTVVIVNETQSDK